MFDARVDQIAERNCRSSKCSPAIATDQPLLYHTAMRSHFIVVRKPAERMPGERLRWIALDYREADESGIGVGGIN